MQNKTVAVSFQALLGSAPIISNPKLTHWNIHACRIDIPTNYNCSGLLQERNDTSGRRVIVHDVDRSGNETDLYSYAKLDYGKWQVYPHFRTLVLEDTGVCVYDVVTEPGISVEIRCCDGYCGENCTQTVCGAVYEPIPNAVYVSFSAIASCFVLVVCLVFAHLHHYKDVKIYKASSISFLRLMLIGALVSFLYLVIAPALTLHDRCIGQPLLDLFGFVLVFGALFLKNYRIYVIFAHNKGRPRAELTVHDKVLVRYLAYIFAGAVFFIVVWYIVALPAPEEVLSAGGDAFTLRCAVSGWSVAKEVCEIALLVAGSYLSFALRKTPQNFNESKLMALSIYNASLVRGLSLTIRYTAGDTNTTLACIMQSLDPLLIIGPCIAFMFAPKIRAVYTGKGDVITGTGISELRARTASEIAKRQLNPLTVSDSFGINPLATMPEHTERTAELERENEELKEKLAKALEDNKRLEALCGELRRQNHGDHQV
eukprot:Colp12_sorted_trinity150504_noHs@19946